MNTVRLAFGSVLLLTFFAFVCQAQVQRTFVSGLGNDANPCLRTAPCRTFGAAIAQTNAGGEVYVLDSAGYGAFAITKSVAIVAPQGVTAGISVFSGDGIGINAGANDTVILRGLTVNNQGSSGNGIAFNSGGLLHVEGCFVNGFPGSGVEFLGPGTLEVKDSTMRGNAVGIQVKASVANPASAVIEGVRLESNSTAGLDVQDGSKVTVSNSVASGNGIGFLGGVHINNSASELNIENCVASYNAKGASITNQMGGTPTVRIANSTVTNNGAGLYNPFLNNLLSRGNNTVEGNGFDIVGSIGSYTAK